MRKQKKIIVLMLVFVTLFQCVAFAATYKSVIDNSKKGSIRIYVLQDRTGTVVTVKATGEDQEFPEGTTPLADVSFDLYKVDDECILTDKPEGTALKSASTNSSGIADFTNLDLSRYLVVPTQFPSNVNVEIANFLVDVPSVNAAGDAWNYNVKVYPKLQTIYGSVVLTVNDGEVAGGKLENAVFELMKKNDEGNYVKYNNSEYITLPNYKTNANGQIAISNLPDGEYQFVEISVPTGYGLNKTPIPFVIDKTSSLSGSESTGFIASESSLNLSFVNYIDPSSGDFDFSIILNDVISSGKKIDEVIPFEISVTIPKNIEDYTRYLVVNPISEKLILDEDSIVVKVDDTVLTKDVDYAIHYDEDRNLRIEMLKPDNYIGKETMTIDYDTHFDRNKVVMGEDVSNSAKLYFDTKYDLDGNDSTEDHGNIPVSEADLAKVKSVEDAASVHTGGIKIKTIYKLAGIEKPLAGTVFKIADSEENAMAGVFIKIDGVDATATADENGYLEFTGLPFGEDGVRAENASSEYYLVQVSAPDGYNLLRTPVKVIIDKNSYTPTEVEITKIEGKKGLVLPATGGIGTAIFMISGIAIMGLAVIVYRKNNQK